ncbi:CU044_5270 family protein [Actinokineospora diospyrosa]|uniref:CU044_5270 family protein n=1 Tax=Actinokineospora diospyrosa TaxID=103728 RepID=A0ABT1IC68_9PSEU|nr:CU044_5270 family protein [Actinokineospora diospyrosa]MCP2270153.1 hypothetical protein [Actinokineospora diospyrosa]
MRPRIRELLGPLDPMRDEPTVPPPPLPVLPAFERARKPVLNRMALTFGTAIAAVIGLLLWQAAGPTAPSGKAVTPDPLVITAPAQPTPAGQRLADLAATARSSGVPRSEGTAEYVEMRAWYLNGQVSGGITVSAVVPEVYRTWRFPDGSGRIDQEWSEPEFRAAADGRAWVPSLRGSSSQSWGPGGRESSFPRGRPPVTAAGMARFLYRENPPDHIGPIKTLEAVKDLLRERVLTPAERAAVLELLAQLPGVTYDGVTTDRIGRHAEVFSMESAYAGLPARYTLLVAPDSGLILGNEETLTTSAGALNVTVPAVIEYETYVRTEFR